MEFNEKLQELRKQKGLTQEELAEQLYVSRTAVSKWESGRGYPGIDSIRAIAAFFSVTVDQLLSSDQVLELACKDGQQKENQFRDRAVGLLDTCMFLLLFLPFFAEKTGDTVQPCSLLMLEAGQAYLKILYVAVVVGTILSGILTLALQGCQRVLWAKCKLGISLAFSTVAVLLFVISLQPYAAVFAFVLLAIKAFLLIKRP